MSFITNTITNANPGPALYADIETAMLALGWTLVDTVVIGSNTHKVLKSAGASGGNTYGLDWYLDINYPTTGVTGGIRFAPFEGYNATTHVGTNGPYNSNNTTIDATVYSRFGSTGSALETNWNNTASNGFSMALQTTAFTYNISVTRDYIVGQLSNTLGAIFYTGFFTPTSAFSSNAGASLYPLIQTVNTVSTTTSAFSGSNTACLTRLPKATTLFSWQFHVATSGVQQANMEGIANTAVSPLTGRTAVSPLLVYASNQAQNVGQIIPVNSANLDSATIGTIDAVGYLRAAATTQQRDFVTISSTNWYVTSLSTAIVLAFKGA